MRTYARARIKRFFFKFTFRMPAIRVICNEELDVWKSSRRMPSLIVAMRRDISREHIEKGVRENATAVRSNLTPLMNNKKRQW